MIKHKMVGAICSDLLGALCSGQVGAISSDQVGAVYLEFPVYRGFLTKKGRGELKDDYNEFIEKYKTKPNYEDWLNIAERDFQNENYMSALIAYECASYEKTNNNREARIGIGLCHAALDNEDAAIQVYKGLLNDNEIEAAAILFKVLREKNMLTSQDID